MLDDGDDPTRVDVALSVRFSLKPLLLVVVVVVVIVIVVVAVVVAVCCFDNCQRQGKFRSMESTTNGGWAQGGHGMGHLDAGSVRHQLAPRGSPTSPQLRCASDVSQVCTSSRY